MKKITKKTILDILLFSMGILIIFISILISISSHTILWVCDAILFSAIFIASILIIRNAKKDPHKLEEEKSKQISRVLKSAYFFRYDWLKGALLAQGINTLLEGCIVAFPIMVLLTMAYEDTVSGASARIIIYTCLSLLTSVADITLKLDRIADRYRKAYMKINSAILDHETNGNKNEHIICAAIEDGEKEIKNV